MIHMLGRNDPWGHLRMCDDSNCQVCRTRQWINSQKEEARNAEEKLPEQLITKSSSLCRREGAIYVAQCIPCISEGRKTLYLG